MPTIEIVCLEQEQPLEFSDFSFSFALQAENEVVSHRGLFSDEFKTLNGCIYHLGNPTMRGDDNEGFYAGAIVDWWLDEYGRLKFLPAFVAEIQGLMADLLEASPVRKLIFSSDYQFGNQVRRYPKPITYETFWRRHETEKLWFNARYFVVP